MEKKNLSTLVEIPAATELFSFGNLIIGGDTTDPTTVTATTVTTVGCTRLM